jgi:hypothetical protein
MDNKALVSSLLEPHPLVKIHHVNRKPETTLIFFQLWMLSTVASILTVTIVFFTGSLLVFLLTKADGSSKVSDSQFFKAVLYFFPLLFPITPFTGLLSSFITLKENKKAHEFFLADRNIFHRNKALHPIYCIQKAILKTNISYDSMFHLCIDSLRDSKKNTFFIKQKDSETGLLVFLLKQKIKKFDRGETFKFKIEKLSRAHPVSF